MTGATGLVDFFALEAGDYLGRMDELLAAAGPDGPAREPFARHARSLRGSATMARQVELAELAAAIERVAAGHRDGGLAWSAAVADATVAGVDEFKRLLRNVRAWSPDDAAKARARAAELDALLPTSRPVRGVTDRVVPIRSLFFEDGGPHLVERSPSPPITADLRFRQAARPIAEQLRALIAEARQSGETTDGARETLGADLRGTLRDLRELAESYDIQPVVALALAREEPIGRMEPRALATIDAAASALVGAAAAAGVRPGAPTPPASAAPTPVPVADRPAAPPPPSPAPPSAGPPPSAVVPPPRTPAAFPTRPSIDGPSPATPRAASATPPTGSALRALLESSIQDLSQLGHAPIADAEPLAPPVSAPTNGRVAAPHEPVPIEQLLYRGRAAIARAREVRDALRARPGDQALLDELFDLLDLAEVE